MIVWVLTQAYPYEGQALFGVYAGRADAERAAKPELLDSNGEWCTYAVRLGDDPRYYGYADRQEAVSDA